MRANAADPLRALVPRFDLLAEHEVTQVLTLVTEIAGKMGIECAQDPELDELSKDVAPEKVPQKIDETRRRLGA